MKTLKLICLLLTMLIINSCKNDDDTLPLVIGEDGGYGLNFYIHTLYLSFQDASGNDLVKGISTEPKKITVEPELYTLEIDFEDGIPNPWKYVTKMSLFGGWAIERNLHIAVNENYDYLRFTTGGSPTYAAYGDDKDKRVDKIPFSEKITFTLKCPYLFDDNVAYEIVTWWKPSKRVQLGGTICYCIEFEGKEFIEIITDEYETSSVATIVLSKKLL